MTTEAKAKTKWCPFVRQSAQAAHSNRGDHPNDGNVNCIGSDCMAWRWQWVIEDQPVPLGVNAHEIDADGNWLGYCGLAGKP